MKCKDNGPWLWDGFVPTHRKLRDGWHPDVGAGEEEQATAKARLRLGEDRVEKRISPLRDSR